MSDKAKEYYGDKYSEALNKVKSQIGDGYYPSAYFKNIYTLVDNHETVISNGSSLKHDYNFPEKTFSLRTDIRNAQKGPFGSGVDLSITASHMNEAYELIPGAIQNQTDDLEIGPFSRLSDSELTEYNDIIPGVPISLTATTTLHVEINTNKGCSSGCAARPIIAKISDNTYLNLGHSESLSVPVVHLLGLEDQILNLENT